MTLGYAIDQTLLNVTGGKPTTDNSVLRTDIRALVPAAANWAMDKTYNINLAQNGDRDYPSEFYGVFENIAIVRTARVPFFTLSKGIVPLKVGMGLRFVYDNCGTQYSPLSDADMGTIEYYKDLMPGNGFYRRKKTTVDLWNLPPIAATMNYQALTKIEDLSDTDELPLQAGAEDDVLKYLREWFTDQRNKRYDNAINTKDVNSFPN